MRYSALTVAAVAGGMLCAGASTLEAQAPAVAKPTHAAAVAAAGRPVPDSVPSSATTSVSVRGDKSRISLHREVFSYVTNGRRDPFFSLLKSSELRPMLSDLKLVAVVYDPGGRSVAMLRDRSTKEQYRARVGQTLGRMRVAQIHPKSVTFTLEELGFSRQEVLALNDSTTERKQ